MVLSLKTWESRSLPGLPRTCWSHYQSRISKPRCRKAAGFLRLRNAGSGGRCLPATQAAASDPEAFPALEAKGMAARAEDLREG